ncbi:MAG: DUF3330 domain-containing protein [Arenicellales bacterium]|jgi:hypothetical protein
MNEKLFPTEPTLIDCEICFKEIPDSVAMTEEGEDYVVHFCGLDCYAAWKEKNETKQGNDE